MSTATLEPPAQPASPAEAGVNYLNVAYTVKSWLLTKDHKRIALLYLATITFFFFLGGIFATIIRLELLTPNGDLVSPQTYNKLFSLHWSSDLLGHLLQQCCCPFLRQWILPQCGSLFALHRSLYFLGHLF